MNLNEATLNPEHIRDCGALPFPAFRNIGKELSNGNV